MSYKGARTLIEDVSKQLGDDIQFTAELVSIFTGIPVEDLRSATIIGLEKVIELANIWTNEP